MLRPLADTLFSTLALLLLAGLLPLGVLALVHPRARLDAAHAAA